MNTSVNEMIAVFNFDVFRQTLKESLLENAELFGKSSDFGSGAVDVDSLVRVVDNWAPSDDYRFDGDYLIDDTNNLEDWLACVLDAANLRKFVRIAYAPNDYFAKKLLVIIIGKICEDLFDLYGFIEIE